MKDLTAFLKRHRLWTLVLACLGLLSLNSCLESDTSPMISIHLVMVNDSIIKPYERPTVTLGDTLKIDVELLGFEHQLEYFQIGGIDREYFKDTVLHKDQYNAYFSAASNPSTGYYVCNANQNRAYAKVWILPKKLKADSRDNMVTFTVKSNSGWGDQFNPFTTGYQFKTADKKADENTNKK